MFSQAILTTLSAAFILTVVSGCPTSNAVEKRQADGSTGGAKEDLAHTPRPLPNISGDPSASCETDAQKVASMGYTLYLQNWFNLPENADREFCNETPGQCTGQAEVTPFPDSGGKLWLCGEGADSGSVKVTGKEIAEAVEGITGKCGPRYMFGGSQGVGAEGSLYVYVGSATV